MLEDIDYAGVIAQLQQENEGLRRRIVALYWDKHPFDGLSIEQVKTFLVKNYMVISAVALILFVLFSFISTIREFFNAR